MRFLRIGLITMVALTTVMIACGSGIPEDVEWEVVATEKFTVIGITKVNMRVNLNKKVVEDTLQAIADKLRAERAKSKDEVTVWFYLPGMNLRSTAWATVFYNDPTSGDAVVISDH